ncbi:MAG: hypothetical protein ACI4W6_06455 [Acutalibacteraceae bacterium]
MSTLKKISAIAIALCLVLALFTGCTPESKLKGSWRDSTGLVGYDFMDDNICKIVYADTELLGKKITAAPEGKYLVEKGEDGIYYVTITYTVLNISMTEKYSFTVDGDTLTMTNTEDGSTKTLLRNSTSSATVAATTTAAASAVSGTTGVVA